MKKYPQILLTVARKQDVRIFAWCAGAVAIWRACLELINQAIVPLMVYNPIAHPTKVALETHVTHSFSKGLVRWLQYDAQWYRAIIERGYVIHHHLRGPETVAFFPLYPKLVRYVSLLLHTPPVKTGEALNLLLLAAASYFLYKMTLLMAAKFGINNGRLAAQISVLLLLLNPASFFFASLYADALLVFCATASFYFALRRSFIVAALFAGLASGSKGIGVEIAPILIVMYLQANWSDIRKLKVVFKTHIPRLLAISLLSLSGLLAYMLYLWHRFDSPFLFIKIEKYWARNPGISAFHHIWGQGYAHLFPIRSLDNFELYQLYLSLIPVAAAAAVLYLLLRHRLKFTWLALYCFLAVLLPLSSGEMASLNRYILVLTPLMSYFAAYVYSNKAAVASKYVLLVWLCLSAALQIVFCSSFLARYFVG